MQKLRIAVLCGGTSAEREVSLKTGAQIVSALDAERYLVSTFDVGNLPALAVAAKEERPDVVVIALHGPGGEDGTVQGFLDVCGIAYTGSGVLASALAMDKARCKAFFGTESIVTPPGMVLYRGDTARNRRASADVGRDLGYPVIVKPSRQGSTYGCVVVNAADEMRAALETAFKYDDTALVEQRLEGTEITVAVLGNDDPVPLPVVEIVAKDGFFDYEAKYTSGAGAAAEIVPARISAEATAEAQAIAVQCHRLLGCRGMSRTDMFVLDDDSIVVLETNTIPGMTETSLLPKAAAAAGITFPALLDHLIKLAREAR